MSRKLQTVLGLLVVVAMLLAACGAPAASEPSAPAAADTAAPASSDAAPAPAAQAGQGETLAAVVARGYLICGANQAVPGFGYVGADGEWAGVDVDYCRALAAAIFGDSTAVEFRHLNAADRFTALQSGEIDILSRNTTWTLTRDSELGANFTATTFYDGQGLMAPAASGFATLQDLAGGSICVQTGTTTEQNLADEMAAAGVAYEPVVYEDADSTFAAYSEGRCDAVTTDKSGLIGRRSVLADPDAHVILDVTMSKEPLGPAVRHGDDQWYDIAQWTVFALIAAEEYGITSANVAEVLATHENPQVRRLLGHADEDQLGPKLGLSADWAYNAIAQVGNYAEIYNRNLGPDTPTYVPRGLNSLHRDGGILYAPPFN